MKITFVCQHLGNGGAERVISILINYLVQHGYKVQLILLYEERIDYSIPESVEVVFLNWVGKKNILQILPRMKKLRETIEGEVVISVLFLAIFNTVFANLFSNKRIVVSERNDPNNDPPGKLRKFLRTASYYFSDVIIFQTDDARDYFPMKIQKKGVVIANPIKEGLIKSDVTDRDKRIVSVCRLNEQKNIRMSIDAFAEFLKEYPNYIFEIYGEGELEQEIREYIAKLSLGEKVFLKGFCNDVHKEIVDAMMYISSSNYEGISNSMLEAMAIGLPTVCTDCPIGGARQVIDSGVNGILVPVGDTMALKNAMMKIAGDKEFRDSISENAMKVRDKYNTENICHEWEKVLNETKN